MDANHTQETTMSFKGYLKCADGTVAYSSAAYYTTEADALASAERTAAKKAVKYGRTYTAYAIGRGVLSAPGRTFGPEGEVFADDDYADCTCGHRETPNPDGCQCLPEDEADAEAAAVYQAEADAAGEAVKALPPVADSKRCSKCAEVKAAADFARNRSSKDGLYSQCKACESEARKLKAALKEAIHHGTPEQIAAASHAYRGDAPEAPAPVESTGPLTERVAVSIERVGRTDRAFRLTHGRSILQVRTSSTRRFITVSLRDGSVLRRSNSLGPVLNERRKAAQSAIVIDTVRGKIVRQHGRFAEDYVTSFTYQRFTK